MYRWLFSVVICTSMLAPTRIARADTTRSFQRCWSSFWSRVRGVEAAWKSNCRDCTRNWYRNHPRPQYGLRTLASSQPSRHVGIVVFVHGYNSRPEDLEGLVRCAQRGGFRCASFRYPNDQSLIESAQLLSDELRQFKCEVSIVAHSMGGLIAREAIENPALDHGKVKRLIMITPPNHGSALARAAYSMDVVEYFTSERRRQESGFVYGSILDGLSEATADMSPNSRFLRTLNSRPRNADVRYTIVLGTDGPWDPSKFKDARHCVSQLSNRCAWVRSATDRLKSSLPQFEELVAGKGDGIVSLKRGHLVGVDDVIIGRFDHTDILSDAPHPAAEKARQRIVARLGS